MNTQVFVRREVGSLGADNPTLPAYAEAVKVKLPEPPATIGAISLFYA